MTQTSSRPVRAIAATLSIATGFGFGACSNTNAPPAIPLTLAVSGLCAARDQSASDAKTAASTFYQRAHADLHELASKLESVARDKAARLLEAMYAVEQAIATPSTGPALHRELSALAQLAGDDFAAVGLRAPACTRRPS